MILTGSSGTSYRLAPTPIGSGGEGDIFPILGKSEHVAKIYKAGVITSELEKKLKIMTLNPPNESVLSQVAWPLDIVYDTAGSCAGFVMPRLLINAELGEVYKYPSRLSMSAQQKVNIAQNICVVISEVHKAGYVFGDFNPRNIGLDTSTGLVSFLDTDTYHVADKKTGGTYRCNVCAPGYAAPELLQKCSDYVAEKPQARENAYAETPLPTFTKETDNFALAIHVFKLLMNGYTPFGGIIETDSVSQSSPGVGDTAVRRDSYCFKPGFKHQSAAILPLEAFPQDIADLFTRAFIIGKHDPKQRPNAREWHGALTTYYQTLVTCRENPLHQYDKKNTSCPYCEADRRYAEAIGETQKEVPLLQTKYLPPVATAGMPISDSPTQTQSKVPPAPTRTRNIPTLSPASSIQPLSPNLPQENPQPQVMDRKLLKAVGRLPLLVLIPVCIILAITAFGIYRLNRISNDTVHMMEFPLVRYNLLSYAEAEIVNLRRLAATMPIYAHDPDMLNNLLQEALETGQILLQYIDEWIENVLVDARVSREILEANLERMSFAQFLIHDYLVEVIHAMEYNVRNYDRAAQGEVFLRGGEIVGELESIFELTKDVTQTNLFNIQYDMFDYANFIGHIVYAILVLGVVWWIASSLIVSGRLKKLKLINQTACTPFDFKIKKIYGFSYGLLLSIAAVAAILNIQTHNSLDRQFWRLDNHIIRYSAISNLKVEFNNLGRLVAFMPFYTDDPAGLEGVFSERLAIYDLIFNLHDKYVRRLQFDLDIHPDVQALSLDIAMNFPEHYVQFLDVVSNIFDAVWNSDIETQFVIFVSSAPYFARMVHRFNDWAWLESVIADEIRFQMVDTTNHATYQHILLATLSIILGAIAMWLMSKTISKLTDAAKNLKSSTTP